MQIMLMHFSAAEQPYNKDSLYTFFRGLKLELELQKQNVLITVTEHSLSQL